MLGFRTAILRQDLPYKLLFADITAHNLHFPRASLKPGRRGWYEMYSTETRLVHK